MALALPQAPNLRLVLVGQGPLADEIAARHLALALGDRVLLLGYRPDAARVLSAADALVLSSRHEGLPVALMEARALGLPVVATAVGGIPEAVIDDVDGLLVEPGDVAQLSGALVRFASDPALRARLVAGAAAQADRFDVAAAVAQLEALYEDLWRAATDARSRA
jgi:glycosyltransferase involved in cell wall biosynthesis